MAEKLVPLKFKWIQASPEPHTVTMRNTLEPQDAIVEIGIPVKEEYLVNYEPLHEHALKLSKHRELEIQAELSADVDSAGEGPGPYPETPVLTLEGMRFAISQLSGGGSFEPEVEEDDFGDDWDDEEDSTVSDDEFEEDDTVSSDDDEDDWNDEDFDDDWEE